VMRDSVRMTVRSETGGKFYDLKANLAISVG
jgi:hypothetical protein